MLQETNLYDENIGHQASEASHIGINNFQA